LPGLSVWGSSSFIVQSYLISHLRFDSRMNSK
jgi:hypothetical protein